MHFSRIFYTELKVLKDGVQVLSFRLLRSDIYYYQVIFENHLIEYFEIVNSQHYEIKLDSLSIGHIYYYPKITGEHLKQHIGTEITIPEELSIPTILFALLRKDYYGPMT